MSGLERQPAAEGVAHLVARGEVDAAVTPDLLVRLPDLVAGAREVLLDLSDVTFLDSGGLRLVDHLHRETARTGASLTVVAPPGTVARRLLDLVGLTGVLTVVDG